MKQTASGLFVGFIAGALAVMAYQRFRPHTLSEDAERLAKNLASKVDNMEDSLKKSAAKS